VPFSAQFLALRLVSLALRLTAHGAVCLDFETDLQLQTPAVHIIVALHVVPSVAFGSSTHVFAPPTQ
jgi:hypothetical protein